MTEEYATTASTLTRRTQRLMIVLLAAGFGLLMGVGGYTFVYAQGFSYLSDSPQACINCHIMQPQYDSWLKASHSNVANCVDCHLPQENFFHKYFSKMDNGYFHSVGFTFQNFAEPIEIKPRNFQILQNNCIRCHGDLVHKLAPGERLRDIQAFNCVQCHRSVGHGERVGLGGMDPTLSGKGGFQWPF